MKTHQDLIAKNLNSLGNGYLKLITGLVGTGKTFFLFHDLFNEIYKDKSKLIIEIRNEKDKDVKRKLLKLKEENTGSVVILIDNIFAYDSPETLFDLFSGDTNVDVIATSDIAPHYAMGENETLIRGRFQTFYFSPLSFNDSFEKNKNNEYTSNGGLFISKDECIQKIVAQGLKFKRFRGDYKANMFSLIHYVSDHYGEPISFTKILKSMNIKVSINTLISYCDFLESSYLFYILPRENIESHQKKAYEFRIFPVDMKFNNGNIRNNIISRSSLLSKLKENSYSISDGYIYGKFYEKYQAMNLAFIARKSKDRIYISYSDGDGTKEAFQLMKHIKDSFPKIVVVPYDTPTWKDEYGIIHMSLNQLLFKGLNGI